MDPKPVLDFMKPVRGKEKTKHSTDLETSRFSITGRGKSAAKVEPAAQSAQDKDAVYSVVSHMERTLFIVDLSKLEAEGDTLVGSLVMYRPEYEFKKVLIWGRGLGLCLLSVWDCSISLPPTPFLCRASMSSVALK